MGMNAETKTHNRFVWNISMFIISFTISNLVSGVIYDTYVNYLQEVSLPVATSFWAYYGYAAFLSALMLLTISKIGYKGILVLCSLSCSAALIAVIYLKSSYVFYFTTLLALAGLQLHYAILTPYVATYTLPENKISWYSRTYYIGYIGYFVSTYLGGVLTVKLFSIHMGISYGAAKQLTKFVETMTPSVKNAYLNGNRDVLLITAIISVLAVIPVLMIKEDKLDYSAEVKHGSIKQQIFAALKAITNRYALIYILYWMLINFGMGLFTSYYTVFLNRNLHIDKATASLMVSISYMALVLFMLFTPAIVKKFGQVVTLGGVALLSVPFMLIIANGDSFGKYMIPVVGAALFMRSGLINLSSPVDSSLSMELVSKELRPAYASAINFVASIASVLSGLFTGKYLFLNQAGYRKAYYIAAIIYTIACSLLLAGLMKFNRTADKGEVS